jgi:hypothetical protein
VEGAEDVTALSALLPANSAAITEALKQNNARLPAVVGIHQTESGGDVTFLLQYFETDPKKMRHFITFALDASAATCRSDHRPLSRSGRFVLTSQDRGSLLTAQHMFSLRITPLRFRLETLGPFRVPEYKGALFRGGFGQFFRDLVCVTRAPNCTGCPHLSACAFSLVFETPVQPESFTVLRKYPNAPHPFVMTPPLDARTAIAAGVELALDVTLIGRGVEYLPHFIHVIEAMGAAGRYGGRFRLRSVVSPVDGAAVYDGATRRILRPPPAWRGGNDRPAGSIQLRFQTPLRMRTDGQYNTSPNFTQIAHALLRRLSLLGAIYGALHADDTDWLHRLMAQVDQVRTESAEFRVYRWDRMSGRQGRRVQMNGVIGSVRATGDLTDLVPWFRFGEWVHVGSGTSMGMGKYRMETE